MTTPIPPTRTTRPPHGCSGCDARWDGFNTAHCGTGGCHRTFTGLKAFDAHRKGSHAKGTRHCVDPATVGLVDAGRGYPCWGHPGDGTKWWGDA
jgi:hypothetical protein